MAELDERTDTVTLTEIRDRLAAIEAKLASFEQLAAGFVAGPMVKKLFGAIRGGGE